MSSRDADVWLVGGEDVRLRIPYALALQARGFHVTIVGSEPSDRFVANDIPYHRYSLLRGLNPFADLRTFLQLTRLFRKHRPTVVHAFDTKPAMLASFAGRMTGVPVRVRTLTGMAYVFASRSPLALILRPIYHVMQAAASRAASMTVFQNRDDEEYFLRHRLAQAEASGLVAGSGIDVELLEGQRPSETALAALRRDLGIGDGPVVTMVSRLVRTKGVREFCAAARAVRTQRPDCTFLLVGPLSSEGRQAVRRTEVEANPDVRWLGSRSDVPALLAASDVFVLPSFYREGIPRALLEAGAMGLPLITTDMPGCRDVVRDGWNGILVPPKNVKALTRALLTMLNAERDELARMGENSRTHVDQHFTLELVADAYADIYRQLLELRGTTQPEAQAASV